MNIKKQFQKKTFVNKIIFNFTIKVYKKKNIKTENSI